MPALKPGDIVIIDNLGSQRKAVRRAIRPAGAKLFFLPPYSPDLNPIEQAFAKLKHCSERPDSSTRSVYMLPCECVRYRPSARITDVCGVLDGRIVSAERVTH